MISDRGFENFGLRSENTPIVGELLVKPALGGRFVSV
jgi:hypothetical protein